MSSHLFSSLCFQSIVAAIVVWLWNSHEDAFQRAFVKSGRIDVDPTCKWLVHTAVDESMRAITAYLTDVGAAGEQQRNDPSNFSIGFASAYVVSKALTSQSCLDRTTVSDSIVTCRSSATSKTHSSNCLQDSALPNFHELTKFLDECRLVALHS